MEQSWRTNLVELETELAASKASWKVVVGHHPVRSNGGEHGDTPELRGALQLDGFCSCTSSASTEVLLFVWCFGPTVQRAPVAVSSCTMCCQSFLRTL